MKDFEKIMKIAGITNINENAFSQSIYNDEKDFETKEKEISGKLFADLKSKDEKKIAYDLISEAELMLGSFNMMVNDFDKHLGVPKSERFYHEVVRFGEALQAHCKKITGFDGVQSLNLHVHQLKD